jgi:hypothetical protein
LKQNVEIINNLASPHEEPTNKQPRKNERKGEQTIGKIRERTKWFQKSEHLKENRE